MKNLSELFARISPKMPVAAIVGTFQQGKSTLLNCNAWNRYRYYMTDAGRDISDMAKDCSERITRKILERWHG